MHMVANYVMHLDNKIYYIWWLEYIITNATIYTCGQYCGTLQYNARL